jgi:hypothetical protein
MAEVAVVSENEELINNLAGAVVNPAEFHRAQRAIVRQIAKKSRITSDDLVLLGEMAGTLRSMDCEDLDMPHQSCRMRGLSARFADQKKRMLKRLAGDSI